MATVSGILDHISKWEGGLSDNPNDAGGLTNRGVTIGTFKTLAPSLIGVDGTPDNLRNLTQDQWVAFVTYYWNKVMGDSIDDQCVANMIADWYWGSGSWAVANVVKVLNDNYNAGLPYNGVNTVMNQDIIDAINAQDPVDLYKNLYAARIQYYNNLVAAVPTDSVFLNGWTNRVNDLKC